MGENDGKDSARGQNNDALNLNPGNSLEENVNLHMLATTVVSLEPGMTCDSCASLQETLNATYVVLQNSKQQNAKTVATLKKKIISTDVLIREYQSQKNECEVLKRKIEEFACLVSQLDKDLTRYKAELLTALNELEPLKKADADRMKALEEARKENELLRDQAAALKVTNDQLEAKVRLLENAETLAAHDETKLSTLEKELKKLQRTSEQFKEEKTECRKKLSTQRHEISELRSKLRKAHKYAMTWGKLADKHGILAGANRRIFESWSQPKGDLLSTLDQGEEEVGDISEEDVAAIEDSNGGQLLETLLEQEDVQCKKEETSKCLVATLPPDIRRKEPPEIEKIVGTSDSLRGEITDATVTDTTSPTLDSSDRINVAKCDSGDLLTVDETIKEENEAVAQDNRRENVLLTATYNMDCSNLDSQAATLPGNSDTPLLLTSSTASAESGACILGITKTTFNDDLLLSDDSQPLESQAPIVSSGLTNFSHPPSLQVPQDNVIIENLDLSSDEEEVVSAAPTLLQLRQGSNETGAFQNIQRADTGERDDFTIPTSSAHPVSEEITATELLRQNSPPPLVQDAIEPSDLPVSENLPKDIELFKLSSFPNNESALEIEELYKNEIVPLKTRVIEDLVKDVEGSSAMKARNPVGNKPSVMEAEPLQESDAAVFKVPDLSLIPDIAPLKSLRSSDSYEKNLLPITGFSEDRAPKPTSDLETQKEELEEILRLMTADVPFLSEDDMITPLPPSPVREISASPTPSSHSTRPQTFHSSSVGFEPTLTDSDLLPVPKLPTPTSESVFEKIPVDTVPTKEVSVLQPDTVPKAKSASLRPACVFDWRGKKLEAKPSKGRPMFLNIVNKRKNKTRIPFLRLASLRTLAFSETYLPHRRSSVINFAEAERRHVIRRRDFCEIPTLFSESEDHGNSKILSATSSSVEKKKKAESLNKHADLFGDSGSEEETPLSMAPPPPKKLLRALPDRARRTAPRIHPVSVTFPARKTTTPPIIRVPADARESPHAKPDNSSQMVSAIFEPVLERRKPIIEREKAVLIEAPEALTAEDMPPPPRRQRKARLNKANAVTSLEAPPPTIESPEQECSSVSQVEFVEKDEISAPKTSTDTSEKFTFRSHAIKRKRDNFTEVSAVVKECPIANTNPCTAENGSTILPENGEELEAETNKVARLKDIAMLKYENERKVEDSWISKEEDELFGNAQLTEISVEDVNSASELMPSSVLPSVLGAGIESDSIVIDKPEEAVDEDGRESVVFKPTLTLAERQRRKLERLVSAPFLTHIAKPSSEDVSETANQPVEKDESQIENEISAVVNEANIVEEIASPPASPTCENEETFKTTSPVQEIPLEPICDVESPRAFTLPAPKDTRPLMEILKEKMAQKAAAKFTLRLKPSAIQVMKKSVRACLNKIAKAETLAPELVMETAERLTRRDVHADPYFAARHMVALLRKDETELQTAFTPPAPPLTTTQQRMITIIQAVKKHPKMQEGHGLSYDPELVVIKTIQDILLRSSLSLNSIPMYEMSALTRFVTALMRCRGDIGLMRTFWYDIMYFRAPQAYALTYVLLTVWPDVLRHSSFCLGPSPLEQTIVYLLTTCNAVKAVPGPEGKVIASRNLLKDAFGFQSAPAAGANELCVFLTEKVKGCRSCDEMRSLASCFALLSRWEGYTFGVRIVKEHLWPLLEEWSAGQGEDFAAATALLAIGWLGRSFPADVQETNKKILQVLKALISQPENVSTVMQESIMETVILLGAQADKVTVCGLLKSWHPPRDVPVPLLDTLCAFVGSNRALIDDSKEELEKSTIST